LAGREECAANYLVERERYRFHVMEVVAAGRGRLRLDGGRTHPIGPGSVYAYAPDMACRIESDAAQPLQKFFFALAGKQAAARLAEARLPAGTVRRIGAPAEVVSLAENIIHEGQRQGPHVLSICVKLLEVMLLKIHEGTGGRVRGNQRARENFLRCRAILEAHATEMRTLEQAAAMAGMDAASMCRLFRRFQGTSPYQYLLRRKMALAAEDMMESGCMVKEAAARVGFADPYHFTRCFKTIHGVPPTELRRYRSNGSID